MTLYSGFPSASASRRAVSMVFAPSPRGGLLMMRPRRRSSARLLMTQRYDSISLTSARSKNRVPPMTRYGMPFRFRANSIALDWALVRYRMA